MDELQIGTLVMQVERKPIRGMHIYVKPPNGTVLVTAPTFVPDSEIRSFVESKAAWIRKSVERVQKTAAPDTLRYQDGDVVSVWGKPFVLQSIPGKRYSLKLTPNPKTRNCFTGEEKWSVPGTALLTAPADSTAEQRKAFFLRWYRQQTKDRLETAVPAWMSYTGLSCSGWKVRKYKARWGSCNTGTKELTFHALLSREAPECLDYVIMHELCHTVIPNHGKEFHALETKYMPDWKRIRKRLNGQDV